MLFSLIIPVYNRPDEVRELLLSLTAQQSCSYEVIIVEDGSSLSSRSIVAEYDAKLPSVQYIEITNGGPSRARNIGASKATGDYLIFLDSDVVLPPNYLKALEAKVMSEGYDAFGGPDKASPDFTPIQRAINYAMTSTLTTGGIRGGKAKGMETFKPRSFNLGCRRELYTHLGGFDERMRFGEDIDFSLRLIESGAKVGLIPEAWVYHKRRVDLRKFFKQVHNSGIARIHLEHRHPGSTKLVHLLPALFTIASSLCVVTGVGVCVLLVLALIFLLDAYRIERDWLVARWASVASFVQLWGYGSGYLRAWWGKYISGSPEFTAFKDNFYD